MTKSIVFAPKLQSVALKHVLCYRNARRRDARVVCAWGGGPLSQDQKAAHIGRHGGDPQKMQIFSWEPAL